MAESLSVPPSECSPQCSKIQYPDIRGGAIIPLDSFRQRIDSILIGGEKYISHGRCAHPKFNGAQEQEGWCFVQES